MKIRLLSMKSEILCQKAELCKNKYNTHTYIPVRKEIKNIKEHSFTSYDKSRFRRKDHHQKVCSFKIINEE